MPDDDRARRRRIGCDALQPAQTAHPVGRQPADLLADVGHHGRDSVVVVGLDAHDARLLRRAKPDREHRPECDRDLSEDVPGAALADDALDPIDELDRLDATLEHREERALGALVRRILARREGDVPRRPGKPLADLRAESGEDRDGSYLVRRHHEQDLRGLVIGAVLRPIACKAGPARAHSRPSQDRTGGRYPVPSVPVRQRSLPELAGTLRMSRARVRTSSRPPAPGRNPETWRWATSWILARAE